MHLKRYWIQAFCYLILMGGTLSLYAQNDTLPGLDQLLLRLDIESPALEQVKKSMNTPEQAAKELLSYYRTRKGIKHPVDRSAKTEMLGRYAEEQDLRRADNALQHILLGQPAYPPHFCGEDIDWSSSPVPDREWVWQLNRMYFWTAMARAYWHTGDEKYAEEWSAQLLDWTEDNPRDEEHHYAWRSIETGIRGHRWTHHFQHFIDSPAFTPEVLVAFLNSCYEHASYLMTKYSSGSNWGLMEAEGMAFIAITFPEFKEASTWKAEAVRRLNREIDIQVYPDGHQRELAMGYHVGCIGWFTRTWELCQLNGLDDAFPASYLEKIEKMCEVPMKLGFPDGTTTQFGDSWSGQPGKYDDRFLQWAELFDREDFLYMATKGKDGKSPTATAFSYPQSGLYSMRSGWDEEAICLVLKCGPDGGGHCQPDNGTFELYAGGRHLMPDGGSYIYSGNPEGRAWFRQTSVHQTLTLNGANSVYAPKLLKWETGDDLDILVVENKSYPDLTHRRAVFFVDKQFFVIVDDAIGTGTGDVDIHFQLAPGEAVYEQEKLTVRTSFQEGWNVAVEALPQKGIKLEEEEGWVSFVYTKKEPRPAFRYRVRKGEEDQAVRFVTVVTPYRNIQTSARVKVLGRSKPGSDRLKLKVVTDDLSKRIEFNLKN